MRKVWFGFFILIAIILIAQHDLNYVDTTIDSLTDIQHLSFYKKMTEEEREFLIAMYKEPISNLKLQPPEISELIEKFSYNNKKTVIAFEYRPEFPTDKFLALLTSEDQLKKDIRFNYIIAPPKILEQFRFKNDGGMIFLNSKSEVIGYLPNFVSSDDILYFYNNLGGM